MLFTHGEKSEAKNKAMICKEEYFHEVEDFVVSNDNRKPKSDDQPPKTEDIAPETEDHTPDCDDQIPDSDEKPLEKESEDQTPDSDDQTPEGKQICNGNVKTPESDDRTTEKNKFSCHLCDETYSDKSYKCGLCDSEFHKLSYLHIHRAKYHYKKLYKCFCDAVCRSKGELKRHVVEVHKEKLRPSTEKRLKEHFLVECTHCDITYSSLKSFEDHISMLEEIKKPFSCQVCQSSFA